MGIPIPMWWAVVLACLLVSISSVRCEDVLVGDAPVYRPMSDLPDMGNSSSLTIIPNPMDTIPVDGLLTGFQAFMWDSSGCIIIHVWRRSTRRSPSYYPYYSTVTPSYYRTATTQPTNSPYWTFVGKTKECVETDEDNKTITYALPSRDYIRVQKGDVIGYTVNASDVVAYSVNSDCSMGQRSLSPTGGSLGYLRPASSYSFTELNQCRNYSLQVTITEKECELITATRVPMNISFTSLGPTTDDECWIVSTPNQTASVIKLLFRELTLSCCNCDNGYVQINNGDSAPSTSGYITRRCRPSSSYSRVVSPINSGAAYIHFWRRGGSRNNHGAPGGHIRFVMEYSALIESPCENMTVTERPILLRSPGYPTTEYEPNTKLCWILKVAENSTNRVRVRIDGDYGLQKASCRYSYSSHCSYRSRTNCKDYIEVRDGESPNSPMLTKWCNSSSQTNFLETSSEQVLTIYFVTDSSIQAKGFQLKAFAISPDTLQCSHYIALSTPEVLESPHYPFEYPNNRDDCWSIKASSKDTRILVTVLDSRLEDDVECSKDWVEVLDGRTGSAPLLRRWCGGTLPLPLLSSGPYLYVRFVSSSYQRFSGFRLSYKQISTDACTKYYAYSHKQYLNGELQTTNGTGVRCWIIKAEEGRLRIQWESVDQAMNHGDCENTYVELYDGDSHRAPLIGKYCESKPIPKHGIHIDGSIIYVRWVVASAPATFRLAYMSLSSKHCHMEFVTDETVHLSSVDSTDSNMTTRISSGTYYYYTSPRPDRPVPDGPCTRCKYNKNQQTCWVLESDQPNGHLLVRLSFLELQDKDSRGQCKDSLEIHDGRSLTDPLMGTLCGHVPPRNFTSTGNALLISFQSDPTIEKRGFRLTVTNALQSTGCKQLDANLFNSSLENPRSKPTSGERCWTISSPSANEPVRVYAQSIQLQRDEIINFYDGPSNEALLIKRFDYRTKRGAMVVSSGGMMTMVLKTGSQTGGQPGQFMLHYSWLFDARCAYKSITKNATSLTTKGYGSQPYPNKDYACWVLTTQTLQQLIEIHAKKFHLENGDKCSADYLEVYDGPKKADDKLLHRWCGNKDGMMLAQSSGRSLYVVFRSDDTHQFPGFELKVVAIDNPAMNNAPIQPGAAHTDKQSAPILSQSNIVVIVVVICAVIVIIVVVVAFARKRTSVGKSDASRVVYRNDPAASWDGLEAIAGRSDPPSETPPISRASSVGDTTKLV